MFSVRINPFEMITIIYVIVLKLMGEEFLLSIIGYCNRFIAIIVPLFYLGKTIVYEKRVKKIINVHRTIKFT